MILPRISPNGNIFHPCEVLRKIAGNVLPCEAISSAFERGQDFCGEVPECKHDCCQFGNVPSAYQVEDFRGLAGDPVRPGAWRPLADSGLESVHLPIDRTVIALG